MQSLLRRKRWKIIGCGTMCAAVMSETPLSVVSGRKPVLDAEDRKEVYFLAQG